ncbi:transposon ty3-g Gag-Pol polyprotein [Plakobranchus ocellatus]|uniref:Transposon ty3-g Gag-Pol polyprotein n=1 Tax=Plakobranchus ocellatus TaxID=259542 RepID=A0AAV3YU77_9GAST|nr:transposon ty3-g Gag-Pol polyprotein [Plakobranchus ocellatus]
METFKSALALITRSCWMASVDLVSAYYSVPIADKHQKFLKFIWRGQRVWPIILKELRRRRDNSLHVEQGKWGRTVHLNQVSIADIKLWLSHIDNASSPISHGEPALIVTSDPSYNLWRCCSAATLTQFPLNYANFGPRLPKCGLPEWRPITQDQTRYDYVVSALDLRTAEEVQDVLVNLPDADRYATLKNALIKAFGKSQAQRDNELLNLNGLGDKKPTALLRKINAVNDDPQTLKRALFLSNLPADVRSILAGQEFNDVEKVAEVADRIWQARCAAVQDIAPAAHDRSPTTVEAVTKPNIQSQRRSVPRAQPTPLGVAAAGIPHQPNTLSVVDRISGLSYLVDTGAEVSVYPASIQDRRPQQPITTLTAANGTSIHTLGRRSVYLRLATGDNNITTSSTSPTSPVQSSVRIFSQDTGLAIDLRGKCLLSLDNIPIVLRETKSPLTLAGLGFPLPNEISSLLQQFPEPLTPHFHHSTNKHGVEHHIVTHGPPTHARARRLDLEKLSAAKSEFLRIEEMGIVRRSKSAWSSPLHIVPKSDGKWRPCGDYRRLNASTDDDRYPLQHIQDFNNHLAGCRVFRLRLP